MDDYYATRKCYYIYAGRPGLDEMQLYTGWLTQEELRRELAHYRQYHPKYKVLSEKESNT